MNWAYGVGVGVEVGAGVGIRDQRVRLGRGQYDGVGSGVYAAEAIHRNSQVSSTLCRILDVFNSKYVKMLECWNVKSLPKIEVAGSVPSVRAARAIT